MLFSVFIFLPIQVKPMLLICQHSPTLCQWPPHRFQCSSHLWSQPLVHLLLNRPHHLAATLLKPSLSFLLQPRHKKQRKKKLLLNKNLRELLTTLCNIGQKYCRHVSEGLHCFLLFLSFQQSFHLFLTMFSIINFSDPARGKLFPPDDISQDYMVWGSMMAGISGSCQAFRVMWQWHCMQQSYSHRSRQPYTSWPIDNG